MTDNIYLRCSIIVLLCATTFATAGGFGSFAGSSSSAFSSASSNAQATGSVASAISSANAFTGGAFPSKNPDGTSHGLTHQQGISVGSGSFVGIHPGSDKFGLNHQGSSGVKGAHNNHKSQSPCSQCAHTKEKWDYDNYDEQPEEKDEETHGEDDDCDDGQYRPEHHYKHDNSGDGKEHEEETVPGVYKVGNTDQYDYDQENDKGAYTPGGNKGQGNNNYGNTGLTGANNQNSNNNNGDYQHSTKYPFAHPNAGASKDFSHLTINPSDFHKKKENDNKNVGTPGVVAPTLGAGGNYGNANKGPFGSPTPSQTNLGSVGGTNGGCSKSGSGGGCSTSETDSNLNQGPVKIGQTQLPQGSVAPSFNTGENKGTPGCKSLDGNCGIGKIDGTGQYQSTSVGSGQNLQSGYNGGLNAGNKPQSYDQQHTGQPNKGNLPSGPGSNVSVGSGCGFGSTSSGCSKEGTPLQKNTPIPSQTYGIGGSGPSSVGVGSKPIPTQVYGSGSGNVAVGSTPFPTQTHGTFGSGSGNVGVGSKPFPTQTHGTFGSGSGNIGFGNKPNTYDQQHTGLPNKGNLPSGPGGNIGSGSGCGSGSSSFGCSDKGTPLQKNIPIPSQTYGVGSSGTGHLGVGSKPIPTQVYGSGSGNVGVGSTPFPTQTHGTFGSGSGNIGFGNKPNTYDQQHTGLPNKANLPSGPGGNVGAGSACGSGSSSSGCSDEGTPLQKNTPIPSQSYGIGGSGPSSVGVGSKPIPTQVYGSGSGNVAVGKKPIPTQLYGTGSGNVGVGSTSFPTQTHGTFGSGSGNIGFGNKPNSYDQQHTGLPNAGNLPSGPSGTSGVGSGCGSGSPSSGCSNEGTPLQKNTPIPSQTYGTAGSGPGYVGVGSTLSPTQTHGTFGSGSGNIGFGNKPNTYDQQHAGLPNKANLPSGPGGNVGGGSGCGSGSSSSGCSNEGTPLQKNTPIPSQTYGVGGSGTGHLGVASKPIPTQVHGSGSGNVGVGSTPFPTQTHGTFGSGSGNAGFGNKPHSYDQQHTGIPNAGNLPSGPGGNVGGGSGCGSGSPSSGCSNEGTPLQKNIPIPSQTYGSTGSGPVGKKPIPTQLYGSGSGNVGVGSTLSPTQTHGTFGSGSGNVDLGNKPHSYDQHNIGQPNKGNVPSGPSGTVGVGSGSTSGESSAPCNDDGTPLQKNIPISSQAFGSASSGSGQSAFGNPNSYQFNTGNPFLYGGQPNSKPNIYPTSSPPFSNSLSTTVKPIGHGNPFLDGTITNTFGSQHVTSLGVTPIQNDVPNKPIGAGNPFLSSGGAGSSTFGTAIHPGINIENNSPSTVRPIGQNNPFFGTPSGNSVNKYPSGVDSNKNTPFGSGTSNPSSSNDQNSNVQFPKSKQTSGIPGVIGISSSGTYPNTNQGVKGGPHHNPTSGSVATSSAGASSSGFNTPNSYNNNGGHGTGSLIGTANIKKPSYTLLNSPNSANDNGNNPNGQFNHQIANAGAQSFAGASAGASAGSYAGSFSSSQASSSSSSFASSKSGSYAINGDPNILHQLNGNWPINAAKSLDEIINPGWPSSNAGSQASAFASSSAGSWSGPQPFGVKSR